MPRLSIEADVEVDSCRGSAQGWLHSDQPAEFRARTRSKYLRKEKDHGR